jgi:hypothetical protein
MPWFSTVVVFEAVPEIASAASLFEIRVILIRAENEEDAVAQQTARSRADEVSFPNEDGSIVSVRFREIMAVRELIDDPSKDGAEVFWEYMRGSDLDRMRKILTSPFSED